MGKWTKKDIENLSRKRLKHDLEKQAPKSKKIEKISVEKETIKKILWILKRENKINDYVEELIFSDTRKFRFDWAIPDQKIAIEYEGLFSEKSGHTTVTGYTKDCIKYNLAVQEGWKVLRYTALNYKNLHDDLLNLIKN